MGVVRRTGDGWPVSWEVYYPPNGGGMGTHTQHMTQLGARLSRWLNNRTTGR